MTTHGEPFHGFPAEQRTQAGGCTPEPYVKPACGHIWLTLPGADRSYALAPGEARKLLRELERVV